MAAAGCESGGRAENRGRVLHGNQGAGVVDRGGMLVSHRPVLVTRGIPLYGRHCGGGDAECVCAVVVGRGGRNVTIAGMR